MGAPNPATPTTPVTPAPPALTTQQAFDAAYWSHQPPAVQALPGITDEATRTATALQLATEGYLIDVPIMVWGWDAYQTMLLREQYGYTWVPSALMPPVEMAPGITETGAIPYDPANPPAGAIIVSINLADYPPFNPPKPIPIPATPPKSLVGIATGAGYYAAYPAAVVQLTNGQQYTADPRGVFTFHTSSSPFAPNGVVAWFTLNPPVAAVA